MTYDTRPQCFSQRQMDKAEELVRLLTDPSSEGLNPHNSIPDFLHWEDNRKAAIELLSTYDVEGLAKARIDAGRDPEDPLEAQLLVASQMLGNLMRTTASGNWQYVVAVQETRTKYVRLNAASEQEAERIALGMYHCGFAQILDMNRNPVVEASARCVASNLSHEQAMEVVVSKTPPEKKRRRSREAC